MVTTGANFGPFWTPARRVVARGIVACLTCALCVGAISPPPPAQRNAPSQRANQQQQNPTQQNPVPLLPPVVPADIDRIAKALETANASHKPTEEARQAAENLKAQKDIAFWGMVVASIALFEALITAAGVTLVAYTLGATRRAANAAANQVTESRNAAARDLRPYVSLAIGARRWPNEPIIGVTGAPGNRWDRYSIVLIVKNAGRTWAQNVRVRRAAVENPATDAWGTVNWNNVEMGPLVLAPGDEISLQFGDIPRNVLRSIFEGRTRVFYAAWVTYDDPITEPVTQRQTRLYRRLNADTEENISFAWMPANNCADDGCA